MLGGWDPMEHWRHVPPTPRRYRSKQSKGRLLVSHIHQWETKREGEDKNHRHRKGEANKSLVVLHDNVLTRDVPRTRGCTDQSRTHSCQRPLLQAVTSRRTSTRVFILVWFCSAEYRNHVMPCCDHACSELARVYTFEQL